MVSVQFKYVCFITLKIFMMKSFESPNVDYFILIKIREN